MTIIKEELGPAAAAELIYEFLREANHKRPADVISLSASNVAWVLMRDRALPEPQLTKTSVETPDIPGVPKKVMADFTIGLMLGIYLAKRGEAEWPTTPTKPE